MSDAAERLRLADADPYLEEYRSAYRDGGQDERDDPRPNTVNQILRQADHLLAVDRENEYGNARITHERVATMWNAIVPQGQRIRPTDVALMMIAVKMIRAAKNPEHRDSWVDIAGYAAIGGSMMGAR